MNAPNNWNPQGAPAPAPAPGGQPPAPAQPAPAYGQPPAHPNGAPVQHYGQPQAPAYGQPQAPAYGQPQAPAYGQPAPAYGQPAPSADPWAVMGQIDPTTRNPKFQPGTYLLECVDSRDFTGRNGHVMIMDFLVVESRASVPGYTPDPPGVTRSFVWSLYGDMKDTNFKELKGAAMTLMGADTSDPAQSAQYGGDFFRAIASGGPGSPVVGRRIGMVGQYTANSIKKAAADPLGKVRPYLKADWFEAPEHLDGVAEAPQSAPQSAPALPAPPAAPSAPSAGQWPPPGWQPHTDPQYAATHLWDGGSRVLTHDQVRALIASGQS